MSQEPNVNTFSETSALYAVMEKELDEARRICADMTRSERMEFVERLKVLDLILDDLNAERCLHCGQRIRKVSRSQVRGPYPDEGIWFHPATNQGYCDNSETLAKPAPHED